MLKTLSYLNLIFAVAYFLEYLQNGNRLTILGLLGVVVYNWLVLRNLEREELKWSVLQWVLACSSLCFALFIGYGAVVLLLDAIDYKYYPWNSVMLITAGTCFMLSIIFHLFISRIESSSKKDD